MSSDLRRNTSSWPPPTQSWLMNVQKRKEMPARFFILLCVSRCEVRLEQLQQEQLDRESAGQRMYVPPKKFCSVFFWPLFSFAHFWDRKQELRSLRQQNAELAEQAADRQRAERALAASLDELKALRSTELVSSA